MFHPEGLARGNPALLRGGRSQGWETDHIAHRVDVALAGLVAVVYREHSSIVRLQAGVGQVQATDCESCKSKKVEKLTTLSVMSS